MFRPNVTCSVRTRVGYTGAGKPSFGPPAPARCGVVRLELSSEQTSVRADSSASRGSAKEAIAVARLLLPASLRLKAGDIVTVRDINLTVQSVWPRYNIPGKLDHWQVDLEIFQD